MSNAPAAVGVDFGTSNTVVSLGFADGRVETIRVPYGEESLSVYASALTFWQERRGGAPQAEGGPFAFDRLMEQHGHARFLQSFKTLAASPHFQTTGVFNQRFAFEDLLAAFFRTWRRHSGVDLAGAQLVIGRPVRFAGATPDEALALRRYRDGFAKLGVEGGLYVYEPVGAAFSFAQDLAGDAVVLVADFGGGTSDFSLMRFSRPGGVLKAEPLGASGVGVAGDSFDARIVEEVVAPRLGKNGEYRSFGKVLPMPKQYYARLSRWHELALMKGGPDLRELRELAKTALDPDPLEQFIELIEQDLGLSLYRAVSRAKVALSSSERVDFRFADGDIDIRAKVTRAEFEGWIADDLARIGAAVDQALAQAGMQPRQVDRVFLTGGTSFVPAVQRLFADRFGAEALTTADPFESISRGLALIGLSENPAQWVAAA